MKIKLIVMTGLLMSVLVSSCKKEEKAVSPSYPGNEFMTTVKIRLENTTDANDTIWAVWKDLSNGLNDPDTSQAFMDLKKNSTYVATVHFYDETQNPAEDLTPEIWERRNYHLYAFFMTGAIANNMVIQSTDYDTNNPPLPVGLTNNFIIGDSVCNGRLEGVLRHQPNGKDGTFAPGSTDSDVFFRVNIVP